MVVLTVDNAVYKASHLDEDRLPDGRVALELILQV